MTKIVHYKEIPPDPAGEEGASEIAIRWVISETDGAPNFSMRVLEIAPGGYSPFHSHPWEHEVFILKGSGALVQDGRQVPLEAGNVIFIPPGEKHQFRNTSEELLEFICLIPHMQQGA